MVISKSSRVLKLAVASISAALIGGCATAQQAPSSPAASSAPAATSPPAPAAAAPVAAPEVFGAQILHENGRIYNFADKANYKQFLDTEELAYLRTFIGAGKNGETLVYGLTKEEGSKSDVSAAEKFMKGEIKEAPNFYGEIVKHGRYHVFGEYDDWKEFLTNGEMTFTFTVIGGGPKGATVVFAQNKKTQGKQPTELMAKFKAFHSLN